MAARLKQIYKEKIVPELKTKLGLKNTMQVPRILKLTVYMGVG
jgi:large subunit ribosomal protein L5